MSVYANNLKNDSRIEISRYENEITLRFEDPQYSRDNNSYDQDNERKLTFNFEQFKRYVEAIIKVRTLEFVLTSKNDSFNTHTNVDVSITSNEEEETITFRVESTDLIFNELELTTIVDTLLP